MSGSGFPVGLCALQVIHHAVPQPSDLLLGACLPLKAPFRSMLLTVRGGSYCLAPRAHGEWVGSGRVTLRHVSPIPPLDPYVRLSPHTAHERRILWEMSISPAPRSIHRGQLCAFAGYLCTVSLPSPSGPSPCARLSRAPTTMPHLTACRASEFRWALACLLSTLLHIPSRLSRVQSIGLKAECCRWRVSPCPFHSLWLPRHYMG